ncbi:MAG TPA: MaoC/PaaZ C-terminal domain-containing protein [Thermoanaerobaculia bacterium]|nr:MaoC/PaaZ C-terminal domain-containing protein [Thermoanaerobaculia bacterium]
MPVRSDAVGEELGHRVTTVSTRQILAYAAGLGVDDPTLLNDADPRFAALPQLCASLEWQVVSDPAARRILGLDPEETLRGVHVAQDSTFHAPIRPDATVRTGCRVMAVRATSAGALVRCLLETEDEANGEPLVSSWSTSIYRGVAVEGPDHAVAQPPPIPSSGERSGSSDDVEIPIARWLPHVYTECSAIWNPIHTERRVALRAGLADILLHGTATWALAGLAVVERRGCADFRRLLRLAGRFAAPVLPGSVLRVSVGPLSAEHHGAGVAFEATSDGGARVLDDGWAELA